MTSYIKNLSNAISTKKQSTPQTSPIPGRESEMAPNNGGGYSFVADKFTKLKRFLVLGTETSTFYQTAQDLTKQNLNNIISLIKTDGIEVVNITLDVSSKGLASKNDPALLVMALASNADDHTVRKHALDNLSKVARTGTHLFTYVEFVNGIRGWGRALKRSVGNWYQEKSIDQLAYQMVKYQQRNGWSNRDVLRLSHPETSDPVRNELYKWACSSTDVNKDLLPDVVKAYEEAKEATNSNDIIKLIKEFNLPREAIPTTFLNSPSVWEALLENMPMEAMIRNLNKMTAINLLTPFSEATKLVSSRLDNQEYIHKSRMHPLKLIRSFYTYKQGRGQKGSLVWSPIGKINDSLESAFYKSFKNVTPTNKNTLLALDVSGSMTWGNIDNISGFTPREASAALALVTARVEPNYHIIGFSRDMVDINISATETLESLKHKMERIPFGSTNCAAPIEWCDKNNHKVENIAIYTDSDTNSGRIHPSQALKQYRSKSGCKTRLAVVGMVSNGFTIADPKDTGMMDFVGFSSDTPQIMTEFFNGNI